MKKIYYLIAMAVTAFTFTSCEDVPEPFGQPVNPNAGETIVVDPTGSGTEADPYNVAKLTEVTKALADGDVVNDVYAKGYICQIDDIDTGSYGNSTYWISDDAEGKSGKYEVYRGIGLGGQKFNEAGATLIKVGDAVTIKGNIKNFKGTTPEYDSGSIIVELNGVKAGTGGGGGSDTPTETIGTKDAPITVAKALEYIAALADNGTTDKEAYVEGTIKQIKTTDENIAKYKNIDYIITDGTNDITVFRGKNLNNTDFTAAGQINVGDKVVVLGKLTKYVKDSNTTPEIAQGNYIVSLTPASGGGTGGDTPSTGSLENPLTASQVYDLVAAMEKGKTSTEDYYVKGKICSVKFTFTADYGTATFNISDDGNTGTKEFIAYSTYYHASEQKWAEGDTQVAVGDEVVVCGKVVNYNGNTPEFASKKSYVVTINGK